ncbi:hypothetical protein WJX74_010985 [Apatococcus lobatus]|uniref:RING-type E3 ubiquitin transferase n=1 Tax=Apatococcus lobatus TaxID=904363 RepID=A0AAW1S729_9CHLO
MTSKVLCRYHMNGCCRYGQACHFSHDMHDLPSMVCTYYLAGNCAFGANCRYDHVRPRHSIQADDAPSGSSSRAQNGHAAPASSQAQASSSTGRADAAWSEPVTPPQTSRHPAASNGRAASAVVTATHQLQQLHLGTPASSDGGAASVPSSTHLPGIRPSSMNLEGQQQQQQQQGRSPLAPIMQYQHHALPIHQQHSAAHLLHHNGQGQAGQPSQQQSGAYGSAGAPSRKQGRNELQARHDPAEQSHEAADTDAHWLDPEYLEAGYESHKYYGDNTHPYGEYYGERQPGWDSDDEWDGPHLGTGQWHAPLYSARQPLVEGSSHADHSETNSGQQDNLHGNVTQQRYCSASPGSTSHQPAAAWHRQEGFVPDADEEGEDEPGWYEDEDGTWKYWPGNDDQAEQMGYSDHPPFTRWEHWPQHHIPSISKAQPAGQVSGGAPCALPEHPRSAARSHHAASHSGTEHYQYDPRHHSSAGPNFAAQHGASDLHQPSTGFDRSSVNGENRSQQHEQQRAGDRWAGTSRPVASQSLPTSSDTSSQRTALPEVAPMTHRHLVDQNSAAGVSRAAQRFDAMQSASSGGTGQQEQAGTNQQAWSSGAKAGGALEGTAPAHPPGPHAAGYLKKLQEIGLCLSYAATGACPKGEACKLVHGLACQICHKHSLHPYNEGAQAAHLQECHTRHERLAARARSAVKECGICLERVLDKEVPGQRRFGLLSGCSHAFCLTCIRGWRGHVDGGADVDGALRTCPECRTTSYFVTPSPVWPADEADKERIVGEYKAKLSTIDCRHWNFGENACPFGTSCFYRHVYRDGRPQETSLRKYGNSEGQVKIVQPVNLARFLDLPQAQRAMHAHLTST